MARLVINGGKPLNGTILPSTNKNAVLPVMCASLLTREPVVLRNVPDITDVRKLLDFFRSLESEVEADFISGIVRLRHCAELKPEVIRLPVAMRSTILLIPALLCRFGHIVLEEDAKGCTLGVREIDPHIDVFRAFGATVSRERAGIAITAPTAFRAVQHWLDYASVTTTENFVMCAAMAQRESSLVNAACEPHVQEFCHFLSLMGANIKGIATSTLTIDGTAALSGAEYTFADDYHEVATFLALAAITSGNIRVRNGSPGHFPLLNRTFANFGANIRHRDGWSWVETDAHLQVQASFTPHLLQKIEAAPWPYVPADLLPIFIALGVRAEGSVLFWNKIYEGALGWTSELTKFGAQVVTCDPHRIVTFGGRQLTTAEVESPYIIRVAIALLMVAISVEGCSVIHNADPIRRAHPDFVENLRGLGADVRWEEEA